MRRRALTILELIVVMGVIAIILSITLPAITGVLRSGRKSVEKSNIRQVGDAWQSYTIDHMDRVMPGFLPTLVQKKWESEYVYDDLTLIPPAPSFDTVDPNIAGPWTWRLMPYFDYNSEVLFAHDDSFDHDRTTIKDRALHVADHPGFGYNGYYIGGYYDTNPGHDARVTIRNLGVQTADGRIDHPVVRTIGTMQRPSDVIAFCSTFAADVGEYRRPPDDSIGAQLAVPRRLGSEMRWSVDTGGTLTAWLPTGAPIGRHNGAVVIYSPDGHTQQLTLGDTMNQARWIDAARRIGDVDRWDYVHE